jgi:uncharacterized OB-fold protein
VAPRATALTDAEFREALGARDEHFDASWEWDAGRAVGGFLAGLEEGRIEAAICDACGRTLVPPRAFCERCFRPTDGTETVPDRGVVETFSICYVTWDMRPLDEPELPAVIRIDGTSTGGFLHKLGEVAPEDVHIGLEVEAVWRPTGERRGTILDIEHFRPRDPNARVTVPA